MSENYNPCRRCEGFALSMLSPDSEEKCEHCSKKATYHIRLGDHKSIRLCSECLETLRHCLIDYGDDQFEGEVKIRWQTLKSWRRYFHEAVSTRSFYPEFPAQLITETIQDIGCEILDNQGIATVPEPTGGSGSLTYRLGHRGKVVGNAVLVINWFDEKVHGLKGKVELNAYIS